MGNIIYWQKYDKPKRVYDVILKKDVEIPGEWVCTDERVGKYWQYGFLITTDPTNPVMGMNGALLMKNGERWQSEEVYMVDKNTPELLVSQAEQYLINLK